jgi:hypothetical protein
MFHLPSNSGCNNGVQKQIVKPPWEMHDRVSGISMYNEQTKKMSKVVRTTSVLGCDAV